MKTKNKHGRTGVKQHKPRRPLDVEQRIEARREGAEAGYRKGRKEALSDALNAVNGARTIRDARRRIQELVDGQA